MMGLVEQLVALRKAYGLTLDDLVRDSGLDFETVTAFEAGELDPALSLLTQYARALDLEFMTVPRSIRIQLVMLVQAGDYSLAVTPEPSAPPSIVDVIMGRT